MIRAIISGVTDGAVAALNRNGIRLWKFKALEDNPLLHSSKFLNHMMSDAIKYKKQGAAESIIKHIKLHKANDIDSYMEVLKMAKEAFKNIDLSDLL